MTPEAEGWVEVAEIDRELTQRASAAPRVIPVGVCFHAQQCVEKYLKSLLAESGRAVPRIDDLGMLVRMVVDLVPELSTWEGDLRALDPYAVALRYPTDVGPWDDLLDDAEAAVETMEAVRAIVRSFLGLPRSADA